MKKKIIVSLIMLLAVAASASADGFLKGKVLKIGTGENIGESGGSSLSIGLGGISMASSTSILSVERALDKAATDDDIAMIYIDSDHLSVGSAYAEELRESIKRFSERSKKPVVAYATDYGNGSYYVASVADRVFLYPTTDCSLTGLSSTQFFVKDLLDSLGVDIQLIRHGKFKSAGEMYIRNDISDENRLQYETLLGSMWSSFTEDMAASRGLSADDINSWVDGLELSSAQSWLDKGLVDGLKYRDEMEQYLCHLFGTTDPKDVNMVTLTEYASKLKKKGPAQKKIAVIYANGEIVRDNGEIVGEALGREIAKVRADSSVKAVVFRVNSPGGEVVAADIIRREIELLQKDKPVIASYGAYAASGGYLISAGCDKIYTDNATLTGSIGVFGLIPSLGNAIRKNLHVNPVGIGTNAHSTSGGGMEPLSDEEVEWYQAQIERIYDTFVGVVCDGRDLEKDYVDSIAQGRVWAGKDALEIGLADEKGTLLDAIEYAAECAGLKSYRIVTRPESKKFIESLMEEGDDTPLVKMVKSSLTPGFSAVAKMPYLIIN